MSNLDISEWIRFAQTDYDTAKKMYDLFKPIPREIACFLCQQSIEKILKAYILARGGTLIKMHDLYALLKQCAEHKEEFEKYRDTCAELTTYAVFIRYPSFDTLTELDLRQALSNAQKVLSFTKTQLGELGYT
ncbi:MAG: HEPN domain-containing protein [Candidatus Margulisbacteria bacterium]|jgi:HEPN domain-containing protein|nr:HEPN domain-containing protein [Candidatus Margulisiibacteriota bacterium]